MERVSTGRRSLITSLVSRFGTPLAILEPHRASEAYKRLQALLPTTRLFYALKPLPLRAIIEKIDSISGYFDVATTSELDLVLDSGVSPDRCIHSHPIKKQGEIDKAYAKGIRTFVCDNPWELDKFTKYGKEVKLLLRLSFSNPSSKVTEGFHPSSVLILVESIA